MKNIELFEKVINKQQKELNTDTLTQGATKVETKGLVDGFEFKKSEYEAGEDIVKNEEDFSKKHKEDESITGTKQSYAPTEEIDELEKVKLDSKEFVKESNVSRYKVIKPILEKLNLSNVSKETEVKEMMGMNDPQQEDEINSLHTKHSNDKRGDLEIAAILSVSDLTDDVTNISNEDLARAIEGQDPSIITLIAKVRREEFLDDNDVKNIYGINMGDDEYSAIAESINDEDMDVADMFMGSFEDDMSVAAMVAGVPTSASPEEIMEILKEKDIVDILDYIKSKRTSAAE